MGKPTDTPSATPDPSAAILPLDTETGKSHEGTDKQLRGRRRACVMATSCCLLGLLVLVLVAVILFLTLFKPKDPTTTISSVTVDGLATAISFPAVGLNLNITLAIQIDVRNPNRASFDAGNGTTEITYRGALVGTADIEPARIPQRGTGVVSCRATILADAFGAELGPLLQDALAGAMELETASRIPGRVRILGFIKKSAVATARCSVVIGIPDLKVRSQKCSQKTKL